MKNTFKLLFSFFVFLGTIGIASAQGDVSFTRENFYDKPDELNAALKKMHQAEDYCNTASKLNASPLFRSTPEVDALYAAALPLFLEANDFNANNAALNAMIGKCYLYVTKEKALPYLQKAISLNSINPNPEIYLFQGLAFQAMSQFEDAIEAFKTYKSHLSPKGYTTFVSMLDKRVAECKVGKELSEKSQYVFVDHLNEKVNTPGYEFSPVLMNGGNRLLYTGGQLNSSAKWDFRTLISEKNGADFSEPYAMNTPFTGFSLLSLANNDNYALLYRPGSKAGDIYEAYKNGESWAKPRKMNFNEGKFDEHSAFASADGSFIFYSSNRAGGYGGYDIYYVQRNQDGKWDKPQNMGSAINSEFDEHILYVSPANNVLYFASNNAHSMGGLDIFKATLTNNVWGNVQNLGTPLNSPADETGFYPSENGQEMYIASNRAGGKGSFDLYRIIAINPNKTVVSNYEENLLAYHNQRSSEFIIESSVQVAQGVELVTLNGVVTNEQKNPLQAVITITNISTGREVAEFVSAAATGKFTVPLSVGANYSVVVTAAGYMFKSENVNLPEGTTAKVVNKYVELPRMEANKSIILRNVFFGFGSNKPSASSNAELNRLYQLMVETPAIHIEISGHTDNRGTAEGNQILSEQRAKAIVDYLIKKGIDPIRLSYVGYGFDKPVASNGTAEGRSLNRRSEFKIISQ